MGVLKEDPDQSVQLEEQDDIPRLMFDNSAEELHDDVVHHRRVLLVSAEELLEVVHNRPIGQFVYGLDLSGLNAVDDGKNGCETIPVMAGVAREEVDLHGA